MIFMRTDNDELTHKTKLALIHMILQQNKDSAPFKLPNEDDLSQQLGVSRNALRDALTSLEEVGIVTRRRSKGTIANPRIANMSYRLDVGPELSQMIAESGKALRIQTQRLGFEFGAEPAFGSDQDAYLNVEKLFFADDIPAAYCVDHVCATYANRAKDSILAMKTISHYKFLEQYCNIYMAYTMAHITAAMPAPPMQELMQLGPQEPLLVMDDFAYNYDHEIVSHSMIYFKPDILDLQFLRKSW